MVRASAAETNPDGGGLLGVGRHHCIVESVDVQEGKKGVQVVAKLVAVASEHPEMVGRKRTEYLDVSGAAAGRLWQMAWAVGVVTKDQWRAAMKSGGDYEIPEQEFVGRQLCIEVRDEEYEGKVTPKTGFRMYPVDDPGVANWPKDPDTLALFQAATPAASQAPPQTTGNGAGQSPSVPAQPTGAWADIP